jgi:hypothetical protein
MIKLIFPISMVLVAMSTNAQAQNTLPTAGSVCVEIAKGRPDLAGECFEIVKNGYFEGAAVKVCGTFKLDRSRMGCLINIKDRTYSNAEVDACDAATDGTVANACLKSSGRPFVRMDNAKINSLARDGVSAIDRGNFQEARALLNLIVELSK